LEDKIKAGGRMTPQGRRADGRVLGYGRRVRRRRSYFGGGGPANYPTTTQMTGWVQPPFQMSMGEYYTGMTDQMQKRHNNARGVEPFSPMRNTSLLNANPNYMTKLAKYPNPTRFGRKRRARRPFFF